VIAVTGTAEDSPPNQSAFCLRVSGVRRH